MHQKWRKKDVENGVRVTSEQVILLTHHVTLNKLQFSYMALRKGKKLSYECSSRKSVLFFMFQSIVNKWCRSVEDDMFIDTLEFNYKYIIIFFISSI